MNNRIVVRTYLTKDDYNRIKTESNVRNDSLSKVIRDCLNEYFDLRNELATAIEQPGKAGENQTGRIIHILLARTEERIAMSLDRLDNSISELNEQNTVTQKMISQFYHDLMQYLPEIPIELVNNTKNLASLRYKSWLKKINAI